MAHINIDEEALLQQLQAPPGPILRLLSKDDVMLQPVWELWSGISTGSRMSSATFFLFAAAAAVLPPYYGYNSHGFWQNLFGSGNNATTSMAWDLTIVLASFVVWLYLDMRRLKFSLLSYVALLGCCVVAMSFSTPLYFAFKEVREAKRERQSQLHDPRAHTARSLFCPLLVIAVVAVTSQLYFQFGMTKHYNATETDTVPLLAVGGTGGNGDRFGPAPLHPSY